EAQSASMNGLVVRHEIRGCRVRRNRLEIQLRVPAGDVRLLRDRRTGDEVVDVVLRICGPEKEAISDDRSARFEAVIADLIDRVGRGEIGLRFGGDDRLGLKLLVRPEVSAGACEIVRAALRDEVDLYARGAQSRIRATAPD